jgi:outer membrane immunogenic protein
VWNALVGISDDGHGAGSLRGPVFRFLHRSVTARDVGADVRLGSVLDGTMYYLKLGVAGTAPGTRVHYGLGLEHLFDAQWGGLLEWTGDVMSKDATLYRNNDLVAGLTLHF